MNFGHRAGPRLEANLSIARSDAISVPICSVTLVLSIEHLESDIYQIITAKKEQRCALGRPFNAVVFTGFAGVIA
jgi:hypothetical protein